MSDSAIALGIFGSDKAVLATDLSAGVHTLKVTTNAASDGIVVDGFGAAKYVIGTIRSGSVHTLCATTNAPNAAITLGGAGGEKVVLGTVLSGGIHTIVVTTGAANSSVLIDGFGSGLVRLATVLTAGVHTLAVTAAPDNGFAISSFAAGESVIAAAKSGGIYSLAVNGLYVGPLDRIGSGTFVLGMSTARSLKASYTGPLLRLREGGANAEQDIGQVSGALDTGAAAAFLGANSGFAVKAYDPSGNGYHCVQAAAANQPRYGSALLGSKPSLDFDGSDDHFTASLATAISTDTLWVVAVFVVDAVVNNYVGLVCASNNTNLDYLTPAAFAFELQPPINIDRNGATSSTGNPTIGSATVAHCRFDGTSEFIGLNGAEGPGVADAGSTGNFNIRAIGVGTRMTVGPTAGYFWNGKISEYFVFSVPPSPSDRASLLADIKAFYGIA